MTTAEIIPTLNEVEGIKNVVSKIKKRPILMKNIVDLFNKEPELVKINKNVNRDEGEIKSLKEDQEFLKNLSSR